MLTASHLKKFHNISCEEYSIKFNLEKGQINPHHSQRMSGRGNPRFGICMPYELRDKISRIHKMRGTFAGEKNPMYGKTHTLEIRKLISTINKIKMKGEGNSFYGKKHTEKTKNKISEIRIKLGLAKGEKNPLFGKGHTEKTRKKLSVIKKQFFLKFPDKHINSIIARNYKIQKNKKGGYISQGQIKLYEIIKKQFQDAQLNYPILTKSTVFFADIGIPTFKLDIEYDGHYWHNPQKDMIRDRKIQKSGWKVIRLSDEELGKQIDVLNYVYQKINGKIVLEGGPELVDQLEEKGYGWVEEE
jgi:very-short-patch-repair endonuclease